MLAALALAAAVAQAGAQAPADADAAAGAGMGFVQCLEVLSASPSKADFLKLIDQVGRSIDADPAMGRHGFSMDTAGGRGCRVTYTGEAQKADLLAAAYPKLAAGCPQQTADAQGVTCPEGSGSPPFRLEVRRSPASNGEAVVVATLIDLRP